MNLRRELPGSKSLVAIVSSLLIFLLLVTTPKYTTITWLGLRGFLGLFITLATVVGIIVGVYDHLDISEDQEDNKEWNELREDLEEAEEEVTKYDRVTRILDSREVNPYSILDNQTNTSNFLLLNFSNQEGPALEPLDDEKKIEENAQEMAEYVDDDDDGQEEESKEDDDDKDSRFIRRAIKQDYDAVAISPFTWIIPPWKVSEEGLNNATRPELDQWVQKKIYDRYGEDYEAFIRLIALVDLPRSTSRKDVDGQFGTAADKIMEESDSFTEDDYLEAIAVEGVNLLEVVKAGELVYFLPLELDDDTVERFADSDVQNRIMEFLDGSGLNALADEENHSNLAAGIENVDIEQSERLAEQIHEEAKNWSTAISVGV